MLIKNRALVLALILSLNVPYLAPISPVFAEEAEAEDSADTEQQDITDATPAGAETPAESTPAPQPPSTIVDEKNYINCTGDFIDLCSPKRVAGENQDLYDLLTILESLFGGKSSSGDSSTTSDTGIIADTTTTTLDPYSLPDEFSKIGPAGDKDPLWSDVPTGPDMTGIQPGLLGGIPISNNASYTWSRVGAGSFNINAYVSPTNPEVDSDTKFGVAIQSATPSVHVFPPAQMASENYTRGGTYSKTFKFLTLEYAKNSTPRLGSVTVTVNAKVYEGASTLCSSEDSNCDNGVIDGGEFDTNSNAINSAGNSATGSGFADLASNGASKLLDGLFKDADLSGTDANSNANNPDWLNDGFTTLENATTDNSIPTDFSSQFADNATTTVAPDATNTAQTSAEFTTNTGAEEDADGSYYTSTAERSASNQLLSSTSPADTTLGNLFGKIDSVIGNDPSAANSLTAKFAALTNKATELAKQTDIPVKAAPPISRLPGAIGADATTVASNADLLAVAQQMLLAYGRNPDDVRDGNVYDAGSAYTDPTDAWNLNRMSTLMKQKNPNNINNKSR